jgi:hypothetical protein
MAQWQILRPHVEDGVALAWAGRRSRGLAADVAALVIRLSGGGLARLAPAARREKGRGRCRLSSLPLSRAGAGVPGADDRGHAPAGRRDRGTAGLADAQPRHAYVVVRDLDPKLSRSPAARALPEGVRADVPARSQHAERDRPAGRGRALGRVLVSRVCDRFRGSMLSWSSKPTSRRRRGRRSACRLPSLDLRAEPGDVGDRVADRELDDGLADRPRLASQCL